MQPAYLTVQVSMPCRAVPCLLPRAGLGSGSPAVLARARGSARILLLCMGSPACAPSHGEVTPGAGTTPLPGEELQPAGAGFCPQYGFSSAMKINCLVTEKRDPTGSLHQPHMPELPGLLSSCK